LSSFRGTFRAALLALLLLVAACGATDSAVERPTAAEPGANEPGSTAPGVTESGATETGSESAEPQRIVSLSPTATEMLFAIGAGEQVTAVDSQSNFPPQAPTTDLSAIQPSVEAVAALEPDLVVVTYDPGDLVAGLEALGIPTVLQPGALSLDDTFAQIMELGELTGAEAGAADLVEGMRAEIDALVASVPDRARPLTYYHELDDTLFTVTSRTFAGEIYSLAGLENVADPADADGQAGGFPQVSAEFLIDADPDLVFLADTKCCDQTAQTFAARPGFDHLSAVRQGRVFNLDDDVASRWGPRVVELLRAIVAALGAVEGD